MNSETHISVCVHSRCMLQELPEFPLPSTPKAQLAVAPGVLAIQGVNRVATVVGASTFRSNDAASIRKLLGLKFVSYFHVTTKSLLYMDSALPMMPH
jgi:hypothetical protein